MSEEVIDEILDVLFRKDTDSLSYFGTIAHAVGVVALAWNTLEKELDEYVTSALHLRIKPFRGRLLAKLSITDKLDLAGEHATQRRDWALQQKNDRDLRFYTEQCEYLLNSIAVCSESRNSIIHAPFFDDAKGINLLKRSRSGQLHQVDADLEAIRTVAADTISVMGFSADLRSWYSKTSPRGEVSSKVADLPSFPARPRQPKPIKTMPVHYNWWEH